MRLGIVAAVLAVIAFGCGGEAQAPRNAAEMDKGAYDRWRMPSRIVAALEVTRAAVVADVGAGRGYLTFRIADAIGAGGKVVATDVDPGVLALIARTAVTEVRPARAPVEPRQVAADDPGLEDATYDRVLLAEVDHLLADRVDYLRRLRRALAPGGRLIVSNRLTYRGPLVAAAAQAGYRIRAEYRDLPAQYIVTLEEAP